MAAELRAAPHTGSRDEPALEVRNLAKTFGGVQALRGVDFTVRAGEIHGLLGQNGSGKSTLIKVLAGFHAPDPGGELTVYGTKVPLPLGPGGFHPLGMRFVHQDLGLIPSLSVLENLMIDDLSSSAQWAISWAKARAKATELFDRYGLSLDLRQPVGSLRAVHRALLAIVRAVGNMPAESDATRGLLVLDEPTVYLPGDDTALLFSLTRKVARSGAGVLFVSHDIDEVMELTDRVTVLRDGRVVSTATTSQTTPDEIIEMIVGHPMTEPDRSRTGRPGGPPHVHVRELAGGLVESASFETRRGEIVGVTGLSGSGFEDVPYLLFGVGEASSGTLTVGADELALRDLSPPRAFKAGLALVPADRQRDGAILSLSVLNNVSMQILGDFQHGPLLRRRQLMASARSVLDQFDIRPADPTLTCSSLSGGNQQKVLMAKWLQTRPALLLVHEPTQGVDVGAREEIFAVLRTAAAEGMAVLCASSDHEQLALLCDRVLIFRRGRVVSELVADAITKESISERCYAAPSALEGNPT